MFSSTHSSAARAAAIRPAHKHAAVSRSSRCRAIHRLDKQVLPTTEQGFEVSSGVTCYNPYKQFPATDFVPFAIQKLGPGESVPFHEHDEGIVHAVFVGTVFYIPKDGEEVELHEGDAVVVEADTTYTVQNRSDQLVILGILKPFASDGFLKAWVYNSAAVQK